MITFLETLYIKVPVPSHFNNLFISIYCFTTRCECLSSKSSPIEGQRTDAKKSKVENNLIQVGPQEIHEPQLHHSKK